MRGIETIAAEPWFRAKPWLLLGTGETLDNFKPEYLDKYNIWSINSAIDVSGYADVFQFQDIYVAPAVYGNGDGVSVPDWPKSYRYCAIRPPVLKDFLPDNAVGIYYDRDLASAKQSYSGAVYPLSNSTSFAFMFLCMQKIKEIATLGIDDGTTWIAKGVNQKYHEERVLWRQEAPHETFALENLSNGAWLAKYGCKQKRL